MTYIHALAEELAAENCNVTQADLDYIAEHAAEVDAALEDQEEFDPLDWTDEEEAGWVQQDLIDLYRNEY